MPNGPFHSGEIAVQEMAQERSIAERNGAMLGTTSPTGAIRFLARQRMLVLGTVDPDGLPWASLIFGQAGFAQSDPTGKSIEISDPHQALASSDIYKNNLESDPRIGILAIELATRRRLRINGDVTKIASTGLAIAVKEAYPNCPKYIQRRQLEPVECAGSSEQSQAIISNHLSQEQWGIIHAADTLFVASRNADNGVDVSHRGGPVGFIEQVGPSRLRIPDYLGNSMFNTLGNMHTTPLAGATVLDFETNRILQLAGKATLCFEQPDPRHAAGGTGRFWDLEVQIVRDWQLGLKGVWEFSDASPFNPELKEA